MIIGTPVHFGDICNNKRGWIARVDDQQNQVYTIGSNGLQASLSSISVVWENDTTSLNLSEHIVSPWIERATHDAKSPEEVANLWSKAQAAEQAAREAAQAEREAYEQKVSDWRDTIRDKIPADAKAVLIAELVHDQSDTMTDYFGHTTSKTVILGFSRHTRDLFPEMRKAALNFSETAYLADGPEDWEHREKYSMGGGYYLKEHWRHRDGWKVSKQSIGTRGNDIAQAIPYGEWCVPDGKPYLTGSNPSQRAPQSATDATECNGFTIEEHTHTKRGFQMWIVSPAARVDRDTFTAWLAKAKEIDGWYSRKWGSTPAGFAFKDADKAQSFAEGLS